MPYDNESLKHPQRKLTSILAADVVGYSRMMSVDENGTHELFGKCRKIIDRNIEHHGGRIFNTAGDSVMAEFGSTVEAVRCAIEIQEEILAHNTDKAESEQMWFRIGLNVGDVIIEGDDLIGDGVNIASRMESIATPGGISLSGSVYELVHNKLSFSFKDMGPQSVKNITEPVPTYSLLSAATPKVKPGRTKENHIKLQLIVATLLFVTAVVVVVYFSTKNVKHLPRKAPLDKTPSAKTIQKQKSATTVRDIEQKTAIDTKRKITPSYLTRRNIEGVKSKSGERFVIEMTSLGSAVVTIYKKDEPGKRRNTDSGRWWINKRDRICFEFKKFAQGTKFCRIHLFEGGSEFLVSGDPGKPRWRLVSK